MKINKLKQITPSLFGCGTGFAASSILGLDGFRDTIQLPQLFIGTAVILLAAIVHLLTIHTAK